MAVTGGVSVGVELASGDDSASSPLRLDDTRAMIISTRYEKMRNHS